ncbi:MAG: exodeoxyribonuclease VII large subunit [Clostridia bacterium]|nr:exodeoxyribonuclease VII large subunit [Clostridia bacterium]
MTTEPVSVSQLNEYVKSLVDNDPSLSDVYVKGEISNFKYHTTGHFYFTLKDENSTLNCVMFSSRASRVPFVPENGMVVLCRGRVSVFTRSGQYQLYADSMEPDGVGSLYVAYEQLKKKLELEGLFSEARKKPLPKIPTKVGLITSPTGAAVRDMINVTGRRFPFAEIILYPVLVQGPDAPPQLVEALRYFNKEKSVDVLIIGRGGGSIEDLWAFNDEGVARAVAASDIPVISAVGHETDFTICDFAADKRAPTPSAAAELAVPDTDKLKQQFLNVIKRDTTLVSQKLVSLRERLSRFASSKVLREPGTMIDDKRMITVMSSERLYRAEEKTVENFKSRFVALTGRLDALNPLSVISRGYSAVYLADGTLVKSVDQMEKGSKIVLRSSDGEADAVIDKVRKFDK